MSGYVRLKGFLKKTHHYTLPHVRPQGYYFEDFFNVTKPSPRCDMSNHRFSFWPKYVGPIGFKPGFWLKTLGRTLRGTPNGDFMGKSTISVAIFNSKLLVLAEGKWRTLDDGLSVHLPWHSWHVKRWLESSVVGAQTGEGTLVIANNAIHFCWGPCQIAGIVSNETTSASWICHSHSKTYVLSKKIRLWHITLIGCC